MADDKKTDEQKPKDDKDSAKQEVPRRPETGKTFRQRGIEKRG